MNSSPKDSKPSAFKHTEPIMIGRRRSASMSSGSSGSSSSPDEPKTPLSFTAPRIPNVSPSTSPILSYLHSPTKTNSFPLKRNFTGCPVFEEDEMDRTVPVAAHARRATTAVAGRFGPGQTKPNLPSSHHDRGTGMLRRLSLSNTMPRLATDSPSNLPSPPPNTAISPSVKKVSPPLSAGLPATNKPKRSATLSPDVGRPRRAPSPMGERILKGHFDGFN